MASKEIQALILNFVSVLDKPYEECLRDMNDFVNHIEIEDVLNSSVLEPENVTKLFDELEMKIGKNELARKKPTRGRPKIKAEDECTIQSIKVPKEELESFLDERKENIPTRRVTRQMRAQESFVGRKRSAEILTTSSKAKRIKSVVPDEEMEEGVFKKPEKRGRVRRKKEPESVIESLNDDTMIVDSQLGPAVCHSSPKVLATSTTENTYIVPKMSPPGVDTLDPKDSLVEGEIQNASLRRSARYSGKSLCVTSSALLVENKSLKSVKRSLSGARHSPENTRTSRCDVIPSTDEDDCPSAPEEPVVESVKEENVEMRVTRSRSRKKNSSLNDNGPPETRRSSKRVASLLIKQERLTIDVEVTSPVANGSETITINKLSEAMEVEQSARKSGRPGLSSLAKKSLNKSKRILNEREELQNKLVSPMSRVECEKLFPTNSVTSLISSNTKLKIMLSENKRKLVLTGKGKLQKLNENEAKKNFKTFITPAKTGLNIAEVTVKSSAKHKEEGLREKELKLKALKEKEEEAINKKLEVIRNRQEQLKMKNEMKLMSAMKQRQKLEMEKHKNMIQAEKEKEDKHKQLLEERKLKQKEKAMEKKRIMEQKMAETEERRRLEEEMRIAKLKEQEAEQQRLMLEKQKELERHDRQMQELLAEQKAKEKYELKLKEEREKMAAVAATGTATKGCPQQVHSSAKQQKPIQIKVWNYKPRSENDLGLENENSDMESDEEDSKPKRPYPLWAKKFSKERHIFSSNIPLASMTAFMACERKTPDIHRMFKMTPHKRIKRTSSAIWNTPSS